MGDKITITGKVNGDLDVAATDVTLEKEGQIYGNVFVLADNFCSFVFFVTSILVSLFS